MKCKCGAEINPCSPFMDCHSCRTAPPASRSLEERAEAYVRALGRQPGATEAIRLCAAALWGLKQGEEERVWTSACTTALLESQERLVKENAAITARVEKLREALEAIAASQWWILGEYTKPGRWCDMDEKGIAREALAADKD